MTSLKIALLGYGKMGRETEKVLIERGHQLSLVIDSEADWTSQEAMLASCDAAIEFTTPDTAPGNILRCFTANVPVVCGTTGWQHRFEEIRQACIQGSHALFHASNFSISVNIFFEINRRLAKLMNPLKQYEVNIEEVHHLQKLDAPSGTAIVLANDIIAEIERKKHWKSKDKGESEEIGIKSVRQDNVTGTHVVTYESMNDSISISHTAKNRKIFAIGAVMACEFIAGRSGIFTMKDLLQH
ncbi:MAG TPA: 4-hydroxy-tetrahydrodipicolinate reductase [Bacteroidales bacterium]|nr:4-hydroxy-tetrahydrodipicolinate reductase [Bacteroidales bacterium]HSA42615.1 4-hydroxy-tetrahydrodipicolinate reductase [Bacteroidales bacterium]